MPTAPLVYDVEAVLVTENTSVIVWKSLGESDSLVEYGTTTAYGSNASNSQLTENHIVPLYGLSTDTIYHFRVRSTSFWNLSSVSGDYTFRTAYVYVANTSAIAANQTSTIVVPTENITLDLMTDKNVTNGTIIVKSSTNSQVNVTLSVPSLKKYIQVETTGEILEAIRSVMMKIHYTDAELNASGLNESSLAMYWYNMSMAQWVRLSTNISWVYGTGVNMSQNYVWANVSHFSHYSVGGESLSCVLSGDYAPCGEVTLSEVVAIINKWAADEATIPEVVALINAWAATL